MEKPTQTENGDGDPCSDTAYPSIATPVTSLGSVLANRGISGTGGGRSVSGDRRFFKVWASEALLSDDLDDLTDHERTVWLFAMCIASAEEPRWSAQISPKTAKKCKSTMPKFRAALAHMEQLGMVEIEGDSFSFIHAHRWNEDTYGKPPSAAAEATRIRKAAQRERDKLRDQSVTSRDMSQGVTRDSHDHKEEEKEKEEEQEGAPTALHLPGKRNITTADRDRWEVENPDMRITDAIADYLDRQAGLKPEKRHTDRVRGFNENLKMPWFREKFAKDGRAAFQVPAGNFAPLPDPWAGIPDL